MVQISVFHNVVINMVNFTLVLQIAAKIGGEAAAPLNNTASDGFAFTAQKRQLEDAGMVTLMWFRLALNRMSLWTKAAA